MPFLNWHCTMLKQQKCELYLAPMEGVVDSILRRLLTRVGGIDRCVTEFVRVCDLRLPSRVFYRYCPELTNQGLTEGGTPVHIQVLGSNAEMMAANARKAVSLGAKGIDINFGCPAKTVNKNRGGSILLREPQVLYDIVAAIRASVDADIPVTAKMRLGYEDSSLAIDNAQAITAAGASELCVHGRTKIQGYRPPAQWDAIREIAEAIEIPVVANGDLFSLEDIHRCIEVTGCQKLMIGRGLLRQPDLALRYKSGGTSSLPGAFGIPEPSSLPEPSCLQWVNILELLQEYVKEISVGMLPKHAPGRVKQWLAYLKQSHPEAQELFDQVKSHMTLAPIAETIDRELERFLRMESFVC